MKTLITFIIIDTTGIVTFIQAFSAQQALQIACEQGYKPFIIREASAHASEA